MPEDTRAAIEAFIALARDAKSITAGLDARGVLTLASAEAARTVALAQYAAEHDPTTAAIAQLIFPEPTLYCAVRSTLLSSNHYWPDREHARSCVRLWAARHETC